MSSTPTAGSVLRGLTPAQKSRMRSGAIMGPPESQREKESFDLQALLADPKRMAAVGSLVGGGVGAGAGALLADDDERLKGGLKGGLIGAGVGGVGGGLAGLHGQQSRNWSNLQQQQEHEYLLNARIKAYESLLNARIKATESGELSPEEYFEGVTPQQQKLYGPTKGYYEVQHPDWPNQKTSAEVAKAPSTSRIVKGKKVDFGKYQSGHRYQGSSTSKCSSDYTRNSLPFTLSGAGVGAGLGAVTNKLRDKEDRPSIWRDMLVGAGAGAGAGFAGNLAGNVSSDYSPGLRLGGGLTLDKVLTLLAAGGGAGVGAGVGAGATEGLLDSSDKEAGDRYQGSSTSKCASTDGTSIATLHPRVMEALVGGGLGAGAGAIYGGLRGNDEEGNRRGMLGPVLAGAGLGAGVSAGAGYLGDQFGSAAAKAEVDQANQMIEDFNRTRWNTPRESWLVDQANQMIEDNLPGFMSISPPKYEGTPPPEPFRGRWQLDPMTWWRRLQNATRQGYPGPSASMTVPKTASDRLRKLYARRPDLKAKEKTKGEKDIQNDLFAKGANDPFAVAPPQSLDTLPALPAPAMPQSMQQMQGAMRPGPMPQPQQPPQPQGQMIPALQELLMPQSMQQMQGAMRPGPMPQPQQPPQPQGQMIPALQELLIGPQTSGPMMPGMAQGQMPMMPPGPMPGPMLTQGGGFNHPQGSPVGGPQPLAGPPAPEAAPMMGQEQMMEQADPQMPMGDQPQTHQPEAMGDMFGATMEAPAEMKFSSFAQGFVRRCAENGLTAEETIKSAQAASQASEKIAGALACTQTDEGQEFLKEAFWAWAGRAAPRIGNAIRGAKNWLAGAKGLGKAPGLLRSGKRAVPYAPKAVLGTPPTNAQVVPGLKNLAQPQAWANAITNAPTNLANTGRLALQGGRNALPAARNVWRSGPGGMVGGSLAGGALGSAADTYRYHANLSHKNYAGKGMLLGPLGRIPGLNRQLLRAVPGAAKWGNPLKFGLGKGVGGATRTATAVGLGAPVVGSALNVVDAKTENAVRPMQQAAEQVQTQIDDFKADAPNMIGDAVTGFVTQTFGSEAMANMKAFTDAYKKDGFGAAAKAFWNALSGPAQTWLAGGGLALLAGGAMALSGRPGLGAAAGLAGAGAMAYGALGSPGGLHSQLAKLPEDTQEHLVKMISQDEQAQAILATGTSSEQVDMLQQMLDDIAQGQSEMVRASG